MAEVTRLGHAGLQGWRSKAADVAAPAVAGRTPLREDQVRALIGALFFALSALYLVKSLKALAAEARGG